MSWGEEFKGGKKFLKIKEGDTIIVTIQKISRVIYEPTQHKFDYCYKAKNGSLGYWDEFTTDKGILTVNTFALAYALKGCGAEEGVTVKISKPARGIYTAEQIEQAPS